MVHTFKCENAKHCLIDVNHGVAKTLFKLCCASLKDTSPIDVNIKYVGCKMEVLENDYGLIPNLSFKMQ
jgi:hypothetical protein